MGAVNKILLIRIVLIVSFFEIFGFEIKAQTLYSETFESMTNNTKLNTTSGGWLETPTTLTTDWGFSSTGAITGSRSLTLHDGGGNIWNDYAWSSSCNMIAYKTATISAVGYNSLKLNFKWKAAGEFSSGTYYDYGMVVYSLDAVTWTNVSATKYQGQSATQTVTNLSMPGALDGATFYIGFRWINDGSTGTAPGFTIDDISITASPNTSITTSAITGTSFCAGDAVSVPFTSVGTYTAGNVYTAQLSSSAGSFAAPTSIGTLSSTANSGTISATIPGGTGAGAGYRIRVISSTPSVTGADNGTNLSIAATPTTATNGSTQTICAGGTATLSGNNPATGTGAWTVVSGPSTSSAQFTSTSTFNTVFTPAGGAGSYVVRWTISNSPCTSTTADGTITVNAVATSVNAGPDQYLCSTGTTSTTMAANNSGVWTQISGSATTITSTTSTTTTITGISSTGTYVYRWTNSCGGVYDDVIIVKQ